MREWESQSHVRWYCRYHVVIVPKYRRKAIFGALRKDLGPILKELCRRYEVQLVEGHVMPDHVHMLLVPHARTLRRAREQVKVMVNDDVSTDQSLPESMVTMVATNFKHLEF